MISVTTIPRKITKGEELVVIPRSLYNKFSWLEAETEDALRKVRRGKKALRENKTHVLNSPRELLKNTKDA